MAATTPISSASHFIQADDDDEFDEDAIPAMSYPGGGVPVTPISASSNGGKTPLSANTKGKGRAVPPPAGGPTAPSTNAAANGANGALSGNIGSSSNAAPNSNRRWIGNVQVETRYTGIDTLDEPITATIGRDLLSIYTKLVQVLYPRSANESSPALRDWDLWGPLVLCLGLAVMLSINVRAPPDQSLPTFSSVVVLISVGSVVVTLQTQLLGGRVSFFQALCVLGYCIAPLDIAALISCFVRLIYVRVPLCLLCWAWCVWASVRFFEGTKIEANRVMLAVYPLL
ncbi:hypothetical protein FRC17_007276 [Serendipita sp. 399]|nr:hypothetical protein FRC17_007276 [Serendipita sp. 399]